MTNSPNITLVLSGSALKCYDYKVTNSPTITLVLSGSALECYDCKVSATSWEQCDALSQHCTGSCATLMTSARVDWGIETTERRLCVPKSFSDGQYFMVLLVFMVIKLRFLFFEDI